MLLQLRPLQPAPHTVASHLPLHPVQALHWTRRLNLTGNSLEATSCSWQLPSLLDLSLAYTCVELSDLDLVLPHVAPSSTVLSFSQLSMPASSPPWCGFASSISQAVASRHWAEMTPHWQPWVPH